MSDLGDMLAIDVPPATGRRRVRCRNPRCHRWVYADRAVYGYGEDCAELLGLVVVRRRRPTGAHPDPDLFAELAAILAADPTLLALAELPAAADACPDCGCCPASLCKAALEGGSPCLLLAAPRPDPAAAELVLACPCAPVACDCTPPAHVRGVVRCRHHKRMQV